MADGKRAFEKRQGQEFDGQSIPLHPTYRKRQVKSTSVWKGNAERNIVRLCATCVGTLVRRLEVADYEDLQESEASEVYGRKERERERERERE